MSRPKGLCNHTVLTSAYSDKIPSIYEYGIFYSVWIADVEYVTIIPLGANRKFCSCMCTVVDVGFPVNLASCKSCFFSLYCTYISRTSLRVRSKSSVFFDEKCP